MFGEDGDAIAIVGMAGRFPGAPDLAGFRDNLRAGVTSFTRLTDDELRAAGVAEATLSDPDYVKVTLPLDGLHLFEPARYRIPPREAEAMDPQLRVLLETCDDALQDAGYDPGAFDGRIGVYTGARSNEYLAQNVRANPRFMEAIGEARARIANQTDFLSTSVSYHLGLRGPSLTSVTACSTSLVNVHTACAALFHDECDMALAGGVEIPLPAHRGYRVSTGGGILAPDGVVRPYDAGASGTVFGAGAGVVLLKRLSDALLDRDAIHALIIGSAINNDGAGKSGYSAPSETGQAEVLASALHLAGVEPETVGYVEGHGTGTPLGDPVEVAALNRVYGAHRRGSRDCVLGSVKANVGHLGAAAGICGLVKAAHSVRDGIIPGTPHFHQPNPGIAFDAGPFHVVERTTRWPERSTPRRAGVSSFGVGGTNAHVVLEQPPLAERNPAGRPHQLLTLSARTPTALAALTERYRAHLEEQPDDRAELADLAHTLATGRADHPVRRSVVARDRAEALRLLAADPAGSTHPVSGGGAARAAFLFPGQGAQYAGMARGLYEREPEFAALLDHFFAVLRRSHDLDLRAVLFPEAGRATAEAEAAISLTSVTQPALFAVEYALARLLMSWGVQPAALVGHSSGEYVAAALAGVMTPDDALRLVADRGLLIESLEPGAMAAVTLPEDAVRPLLPPDVDVAAVNATDLCVVSGPTTAVRELERSPALRAVGTTRLRTSHAFHSGMMEPIMTAFRDRIALVRLRPPRIPFVSNVTGEWITPEQATDPEYWARHLRACVRFADAARLLRADGGYRFVEVGPGHALSHLVTQNHLSTRGAGGAERPGPAPVAVPTLPGARDERDDLRTLQESLGTLWAHGSPVNWERYWARELRGRVHAPTYPYEREPFWVEPESGGPQARTAAEDRPLSVPTWSETAVPATSRTPKDGPWIVFANQESEVATELVRLARAAGTDVLVVVPGARYERSADGRRYTVRPRERADYVRLATDVLESGPPRVHLVHAWLLGGLEPRTERAAVTEQLDRGLHSLMATLRGFSRRPGTTLEVSVLTSGAQDVLGDGDVQPAKAAVLGLVRTVPRESPGVTARSVDTGSGPAEVVAAQVLGELRSAGTEREVAYRGRKRWVPGHTPLAVDLTGAASTGATSTGAASTGVAGVASSGGGGTAAASTGLREAGVYLVTGGLGGLGLALAGQLARSVRARLVLVGRGGLPPRSEWTRLASSSPDDALRERLRAVLAVEEAGGRVLCRAADVTDEERMRAVRAEVMREFGPVHGVFHLAGVAGGGLLELRDPDAVTQVVAPKVHGAYLLDRLFRPPLMVLYSSLAAVVGDYGQSDYAAANAVLDAFAQARSGAGRRVVSVNWPQWSGTGMAARAEYDVLAGYEESTLTPAQGSRVLGAILASGAGPQVVVCPGGLRRRSRKAAEVAAAVVGPRPAAPRPVPHRATGCAEEASAEPRTDVERRVARLWQRAIGVPRVGLDDDFRTLGGSSVAAVRLVGWMAEEFGVDVSLRDFFTWGTLRSIAKAVENARG